jgi:crotonobetainyl-CoA:carnitine CoA-transferase CaiB-like acyl-CoA transferase
LADGVAALAGAYAVMLALYHRDVTQGGGQVIDLSLLEPLVGILGPGPSVYDQLGLVSGRHGNRSTNNAPRNAYLTSDGRWVAISASATSVAERVRSWSGRPDIAEQSWFPRAGERVKHADMIDARSLNGSVPGRWRRSRRAGRRRRWPRSMTSRNSE